MKEISILLLLLHVCLPCSGYYASALIKTTGRSLDTNAALKQAAQVLNVAEPANWNTFIDPATTTGSTGEAEVGTSTLATVMAGWSIPDQFREQAVQSVNLLVLAATEGTYSAQAFLFGIQSGALLSTLLVATRRLDSPADPNAPVAVSYVTINSNANVKQQYTVVSYRECHNCIGNIFGQKCCHDQTRNEPRGDTLEELEIIKNKMKADQFAWFNQQPLAQTLRKRSLSASNNDSSLANAIQNFLSSDTVKTEVLASYNDSILSALQSNIGSLKLSSQSLQMTKVSSTNLHVVLSTLSTDYNFEDVYQTPQFSQQLKQGRFSYENLFTTSINDDKKQLNIKYIWIVGQSVDQSTYSISFLFVDITSQSLVNTLLSNDTKNKQLKIVRTSKLNDQGEFSHEDLPTSITPWQPKTTKIALDLLRFIAASTLYPQQHRMLSYFHDYTNTAEPRVLAAKIIALSKAVSAAADAWKDIVTAFKSSSSTTITRIVRFGFTYFNQKSTVLKAIDMPADKATEFINALVIDYSLPAKGSFALGLTYSDDFAWDRIDYLYSPTMNGNYRSLTIFKNGDSLTNTASFFIVDIDADWQLAPDLLIIQTSKSYLGGIWESNKQSIQEVPHVFTLDEAVKLQQFFMLVALGNLASTIGANVTLPQLN